MACCRDSGLCFFSDTSRQVTVSDHGFPSERGHPLHIEQKRGLSWMYSCKKDLKKWSPKSIKSHGKDKKVPKKGQQENANPVSLLKVMIKDCGKERNLPKGRYIHAEIIQRGLFRKDIYLSTSLIGMYTRCGEVEKARKVFKQLIPARDVVSWNAMISSYAHKKGFENEALSLFSSMRAEGLLPNAVTFSCILKACGCARSVGLGEEIYDVIQKKGLLDHDVVLGTSLVDMYAKCGFLVKARKVFDHLLVRNIVTWNALIAGYAEFGCGNEALECYNKMHKETSLVPNEVTFACLLKACGSIGSVEKGEEIHSEISKRGLLRSSIVLGNSLVDMYIKCGMLTKAIEAFNELVRRDVVSWTTLLCGYGQHGLDDETLKCYERMQHEGVQPDAVTFCCILKSCGNNGLVEKGEEIHAEVRKKGLLLTKDVALHTALVYMYAKCGSLSKARQVFDEISIHDSISWNALIAGYAQNGLNDEALNCFQQMRYDCLSPSSSTFALVLSASGCLGSAKQGQEIHAEIIMRGLLEHSITLGNALVDMYFKCGLPVMAQEVFEKLPERDNLSWNALITGYAQLGHVNRVFISFTEMMAEGIVPNVITFVLLLTACSYAGLVDEGQMCLDNMSTNYSLAPTLEHYTSLVDLLSRAGCFIKAIILIKTIPTSDRHRLWWVLLGASLRWVNLTVAKWVFEHCMELDGNDASTYICMSNIYADASMQGEFHCPS